MEHFLGHVASMVSGYPGRPCRFSPGFLALQVPGIVKKWTLAGLDLVSGLSQQGLETQAGDLAWGVSW